MNIEKIKKEISQIDTCLELDEIRKFIDKQIKINLDKRENFMYRDYIDDYFYAIVFDDNSRDLQCKGNKAYDIFIHDSHAVRIETKTKELYPKCEILMIKEKGAGKLIPAPTT